MRPVAALFGLLTLANIAAWLWALAAFDGQPVLLGMALLAWSLGLRHAVDADHIAAIDNATRKFLQDGRRPIGVGLFFALGHSAGGGLLARLCRPLFRLIARPWHMLLLGFLFGLGFDTATEVALLGLSASQAAQGLSIWTILVFPALFASSMALVDTADGVLMLRAYGWALADPLRRLGCNIAITLVSVAVAVAVAVVQLLGLVGEEWGPSGAFWDTIGRLNDRANVVGLGIIGLFVAIWIGAVLLQRSRRADRSGATAD